MGRGWDASFVTNTAAGLQCSSDSAVAGASVPGTQLALVGCALFAAAAIVLVGEAARAGSVGATLEMPSES